MFKSHQYRKTHDWGNSNIFRKIEILSNNRLSNERDCVHMVKEQTITNIYKKVRKSREKKYKINLSQKTSVVYQPVKKNQVRLL